MISMQIIPEEQSQLYSARKMDALQIFAYHQDKFWEVSGSNSEKNQYNFKRFSRHFITRCLKNPIIFRTFISLLYFYISAWKELNLVTRTDQFLTSVNFQGRFGTRQPLGLNDTRILADQFSIFYCTFKRGTL